MMTETQRLAALIRKAADDIAATMARTLPSRLIRDTEMLAQLLTPSPRRFDCLTQPPFCVTTPIAVIEEGERKRIWYACDAGQRCRHGTSKSVWGDGDSATLLEVVVFDNEPIHIETGHGIDQLPMLIEQLRNRSDYRIVVHSKYRDDLLEHDWSAYDNPADARRDYAALLEDDNLYTASLCAVLESTDYPNRR